MNRKKSSNRRTNTRSKKSVKRKSDREALAFWNAFKQRISMIAVWFLVAINTILILSLIIRFVKPFQSNPSANSFETVVAEDPLKVEVLNGCNIQGLAGEYAEFLRQEHYDVVRIDNARSFDYVKTILIDRKTRDRKVIMNLAKLLGLEEDRVLPIENNDVQAAATIILGADYESLKSYDRLR